MLTRIIRHEWRNLRVDRSLPLIALLLALLIGYGVYNGHAWLRSYRASSAGLPEKSEERLAKMKVQLSVAEKRNPPPQNLTALINPFRAATVSQHAVLPASPLAAVWSGSRPFTGNYDHQSPINLLVGRFDLAFALIYLYPLFILAFSYNLISAEREQGTLAMLLAQPAPLRTFVAGKIAMRAGLVLLLAVGLSLIGAGLSGMRPGSGEAWLRLSLWVAVVVAYSSFWFSLAVAVNALGKGSATNAVALTAVWLMLVVIIPALLNVVITTAHPVPSRVEMLTASRAVSVDARRDGSRLLARYYEDHPELIPAVTQKDLDDLRNFNVRALLTVQETQRLVEPVAARYDEQLRKQQALVNRYRFISPAIVTREAVNDLAGTGLARHQHFRAQVEEFSRAWRAYFAPFIFQQQGLRSANYDGIPRFVFREESLRSVAGRVAFGLIGLLLPALLIGWLGLRAYRRYPMSC
jgi:ABC-2 type transport system permease protein